MYRTLKWLVVHVQMSPDQDELGQPYQTELMTKQDKIVRVRI